MNHSLITRLVVGEPTTLALGMPVGQTLATPTRGALHWKAGTWVGASTSRVEWLARVLRKRQPHSIVVRTTAAPADAGRARFRLVARVLAALSLGAAIPLAMLVFREEPSAPSELPITPAATNAPVRVVSAAYMPPQPSPAAGDTQPLPIAAPNESPAAPLPFAPPAATQETVQQKVPQLPKVAPVPAERPPAAAVNPSGPMQKEAPPAANPASTQREQQPVSAVVLDEASPRGARVAPNNAPAAPAVGAQPSKASSTAAATATAQPAPKASLERGTGLVAITPDGKLAVFTNPKTRLPQQFKIGDQLPSGDTIRSIDAKEGKVVSSSKEYNLD